MYEDFKDMVEDLQLVIPSTFEECFTYELQILYLKKLIDNIEPGGDYQGEIDNINRKLVALQSEVTKLKNDVNNLNPDEVQRKLDAMQTEINGVKTSIQTITQNVTTLTGNVNNNTTDIETLTGEMTNVKNTLNNKQNKLTFDATPTAGSNNPVTSDGIKRALDNIDVGNVQEQLDTIKAEQTEQNTKISSNKREIDTVKQDLSGKQNVLTFDATPTAGSQNPVTSDGIKKALDNVDVGNVQEQLDAIKQEQTEQNKKISDNKTAVDSVKESVANQETDITALQETTAGHTTAIEALQTGKQNVLTFDATPTAGSNNPVTSDGIKKAIDASAGGGGGGGTGESDFVVKTLTSSLSLNIKNNRTVTYELSPAGIARRTDITISSISVIAGNVEKVLINLPKADNTFSHENLACYVQLNYIGGAYAQVPVITKNTGVILSVDAGPIIMDINNHLYIVFAFYNLIPIS
jgi:predicted  nucleic acid-binding Zn-ribbon protein